MRLGRVTSASWLDGQERFWTRRFLLWPLPDGVSEALCFTEVVMFFAFVPSGILVRFP